MTLARKVCRNSRKSKEACYINIWPEVSAGAVLRHSADSRKFEKFTAKFDPEMHSMHSLAVNSFLSELGAKG